MPSAKIILLLSTISLGSMGHSYIASAQTDSPPDEASNEGEASVGESPPDVAIEAPLEEAIDEQALEEVMDEAAPATEAASLPDSGETTAEAVVTPAPGEAVTAEPAPIKDPITVKESAPPENPYDNKYYKILLDFRARMDMADIQEDDGANEVMGSQAITFRTRFGLKTKPLFGFSALAEGEGTFSADRNLYFDAVSEPNGHTPVADPENIELNRLALEFSKKEWLGIKLKGGRQRIVFDDARFIGNVVWRQNEQTYDAALVQTNAGIKNFTLTYGYIFDVRRIFGNQGPANRRDFDSDSHLVRVQYKFPFGLDLVGFAYLLDFTNDNNAARGNSSNTYGGRAVFKKKLAPINLGLVASYARQTDAGDNPIEYEADYINLESSAGTTYGSVKVGYELLGSGGTDDARARFVTPLATAHKFNGFADVFLNNGGANGLQDLYASVSPKLPLGLKGFVAYHHFWSDNGGQNLGDEVDFVAKRGFGKNILLLTKGAYFFGSDEGPTDIWRLTLDMNIKY